jgi:hypothetical protein
VAGRLSSPRFRRRLTWVGVGLAAAGAAAVVSILFWDTGRDLDLPLSNKPAVVYEPPPQVQLTPAERNGAIAVARRFVDTAVRRERTHESFDLVSPSLRQGLSRSQWARGDIPVQPYPVDAARWKLDYQYANEVGLQVYVVPERGEQLLPMVFLLTMKRGPQGRWLVDSWVPRPGSGGSTGGAVPAQPSASGIVPQIEIQRGEGRIPRVWLLVPLGMLALVFAIPAFVMTRERVRGRRAERAYAAESARRDSSSSSSPS